MMFRATQDNSQVEWVVDDPASAPLPSLEQLKKAFSESPYASYCFLEGVFEEALTQLAVAATASTATTEALVFIIAERKDAQIRVVVSDDQMMAGIEVIGAFGGKQLDLEALQYALAANSVTFGIHEKKLAKIATHLQSLAPGDVFQGVVANGTPPKAGSDGVIKQLARTAKDRILRPKEKEDGTVDMRDLGDLVTVAEGTPLMERVPATEGASGTDVCGKPIPPEPGKQPALSSGSGTRFNPANPHLLESSREGVPVEIENGMMVDDVLVVNQVNVTTGHVRFKGSVIIEGDVGEGMVVESGGDITVGGGVSSATLDAAGSITISKGIIGRPIDHDEIDSGSNHADSMNCHITAKLDVAANFAQYAAINTGRNITLTRQASHCDIRCLHTLTLGSEDNPRGRLLGGVAKVGEQVKAGEIGTAAGAKTEIDMSILFVVMKQQMQESSRALKRSAENVIEAASQIKQLKKAEKPELLPELKNAVARYKSSKKENAELQQEVEHYRKEVLRLQKSCQVSAASKLHSRLTVQFGKQRVTSERDYGPSIIKMTDEGLQISPI
ncbi:DUF342 domain-containing protein [Corallincola holothuriorum]|uniref:DUF342 domain-containing protein n=1 Tax=Corallincola holothuriorum TaxID=2282215 RepID=A0A368NIH2_9GAMM|nr:FapA family protein [Corallincola holothuriorum]RCU49956.1 DUF342 domain-containing protein [Corallincola holothuriorum]